MLAEASTESFQVSSIVMGLIGGLALFLFGLDQMSDALKLIAGDGMKKVLAKLTTNRFSGFLTGVRPQPSDESSAVVFSVSVLGFLRSSNSKRALAGA